MVSSTTFDRWEGKEMVSDTIFVPSHPPKVVLGTIFVPSHLSKVVLETIFIPTCLLKVVPDTILVSSRSRKWCWAPFSSLPALESGAGHHFRPFSPSESGAGHHFRPIALVSLPARNQSLIPSLIHLLAMPGGISTGLAYPATLVPYPFSPVKVLAMHRETGFSFSMSLCTRRHWFLIHSVLKEMFAMLGAHF